MFFQYPPPFPVYLTCVWVPQSSPFPPPNSTACLWSNDYWATFRFMWMPVRRLHRVFFYLNHDAIPNPVWCSAWCISLQLRHLITLIAGNSGFKTIVLSECHAVGTFPLSLVSWLMTEENQINEKCRACEHALEVALTDYVFPPNLSACSCGR